MLQNYITMKNLLCFLLLLLTSFTAFAQYGYRDGNRIGLTAGLNQTTLTTTNFNTKPLLGWNAGMSVRGNYYNNWSMVFGMQFFENHYAVETVSPLLLQQQEVDYKIMGAQIRLLFSYNIVKNHVSLDFGPVLQVNGKVLYDKADENNLISGTLLKTSQIADVTNINGNLYAGVAAGNKRVRAIIFYQYGVNNFLNKLNQDAALKILNSNKDFKGHLGIISAQILFNL